MRIVVAPNAFKGSLSATQAATAIARGVREVIPGAEVLEIPVADGGDGTVEALVGAHHGTYGWVDVEGPLGDPVHAAYGLIDGGRTAGVLLATAIRVDMVSAQRRAPRTTCQHGIAPRLVASTPYG